MEVLSVLFVLIKTLVLPVIIKIFLIVIIEIIHTILI
jgi:hypothetical protein